MRQLNLSLGAAMGGPASPGDGMLEIGCKAPEIFTSTCLNTDVPMSPH